MVRLSDVEPPGDATTGAAGRLSPTAAAARRWGGSAALRPVRYERQRRSLKAFPPPRDYTGMEDGEVKIPEWHVAELADFFTAHDRWLFGHACARTRGDGELAADLVQDTFEAAARAWDTLRAHPGNRQRAWLLSTLAHKDISEFRHREAFRRRQTDIAARYQPTAADTEASALNAVALAAARSIIDDLPPRQREIALLRWQDHLRITEIAARLGVAEGTVHASLHAARRKLADGLQRYYPSGEGAAS